MARFEKEFVRNFLGMHRQLENLLNETMRGERRHGSSQAAWNPPADVFETEDGFLVRLDIAGLDLDNLDVMYEDGELTVEGMRFDTSDEGRIACHQMEIPYGRFRRSFAIGRSVDADGITAYYNDGFLTIRLPKSEPGGRRKVDIEVE